VFRADLPICADMGEFAEMAADWADPELVRFSTGEEAHREWLEWSEPAPREGVKLDLGPCVKAMREVLPADTIICNGAGNFSGWWHRYWRYGVMPTQWHRPAAQWATASPPRLRPRCVSRTGRWFASQVTATS
jgi:acetolactate synthase-1/2/3 large subunit